MKKTKHIFPAFSFYDRTGIQQFLEKKAREGWMLEKMGGFSWLFRAIEPKHIHFAVTYFPKASMFDPQPSEQQQMFQEFCAHSGWNLVASSAQLQIFCNEQEDPVPIETDPRIELDNIHRTAKKTYLPTYFMLLPVGFMPWLPISMAWNNDPVGFLSTNIYYFNILTSVITLPLCAVELIGYFRWRSKAKKAAEDGEFVATRGQRRFQMVLVWFMLICLVMLIVSSEENRISVMLIAILVLLGVAIAISVGATRLMKKLNVSARKNMLITYAIIAVLSLAVTGLGTFGVIGALNQWNPEKNNLPTYEFHGEIHTLYRDEIPLTIQDFMDVDPGIYSYRYSRTSESLLVRVEEAYQRPRYDMLEQPELEYRIVDVKVPFLYDFCLNTLLESGGDAWSEDIYGNVTYDEYRQIDAAPWCADAAYQEYNGDYANNKFILCYDDLIVEFDPDWEMTQEQMAVVSEIFG